MDHPQTGTPSLAVAVDLAEVLLVCHSFQAGRRKDHG